MQKRPLPPGFEALGEISSGAKGIIDQIARERKDDILSRCVSGQTVLNLTMRDSGKSLYCVYKQHDQTQLTVSTDEQTLDWLFRGKNFVLSGGQPTDEDVTFNLADIAVGHG